MFPEVYLSAPGLWLPETKFTNADILEKIRANFRGSPSEWEMMKRRLLSIFSQTGSENRYLEFNSDRTTADYSVEASRRCLVRTPVAPENIGTVIYAGIGRDYYEPATAMEVASKLNIRTAHCFDVTSACGGFLQAVQVYVGSIALSEGGEYALICATEASPDWISYNIQTKEDLQLLSAGLTLGHAAVAMLLSRYPFPVGGRILGMLGESLPEYYGLCSVPVGGIFVSDSVPLFNLSRYLPDHAMRLLKKVGWSLESVDHWVLHQPSEAGIAQLMRAGGVDLDKVSLLHRHYGNTASTSVPLVLHHLLQKGVLKKGDRLVLGVAAAGFTMISLAVEWL